MTQGAQGAAATSAVASGSASKVARTTITILIVIASSVGGVAILWTIIRKWKFKASSQFEDRMRPIDWQPTTGEDDHIPGVSRKTSNASSFHSGAGHDGMGGGYATSSDHSHRGPSPLPPMPEHDFPAGPSSFAPPAGGYADLAPVGGYADLNRGMTPQPQMQELARGPSMVRPQYDQYGVPLHHQGAYGAQDAYTY